MLPAAACHVAAPGADGWLSFWSLGRVRAMKTETIRLLIIIFVALPLFASLLIPAGQPRYRLKERVEAMQAYALNPSVSTKAALDDEFARLHQHEKTQGVILVPALLLVDAVVIYFFWDYGTRKKTAS
jgi:hypothetical protein